MQPFWVFKFWIIFRSIIITKIIGPQLFGLMPDNDMPNPRNARTLTLISKTIQQLANFTTFDRTKEPFMIQLNSIINANRQRMIDFLNNLVTNIPEPRVHRKSQGASSLSASPIGDSVMLTNSSSVSSFIKRVGTSIGNALGVVDETGDDVDFEQKQVDIEINLAALYRHFLLNYPKMHETAVDDLERRDLLELESILEEMQRIEYERTTKAITLTRRTEPLKKLSTASPLIEKSKTIE
jgi:hypothetical protein